MYKLRFSSVTRDLIPETGIIEKLKVGLHTWKKIMGGQAFSKLRGSLVTRPMQRFNIEPRTEKLLRQEKPIPAPKHQSDQELLETIREERPEIVEAAVKKDEILLDRLKDVYTTSNDPVDYDPDINRKVPEHPDRPYPGKGVRSAPGSGFSEASQLMTSTKKKNVLALDEIQSILDKFPSTVNNKSKIILDLSEKHGLPVELLLNLHEYYQVFHYQAKSQVEETLEHDPYAAQDSWQDADESKFTQKQVSSSPTTKSLPQI